MRVLLVFFALLCFAKNGEAQRQGYSFATNESIDDATFWKIIDKSRKGTDGNVAEQKANLVKLLRREEAKDIVRFNNHFMQLLHIANDTKLHAAIKLIANKNIDDPKYFDHVASWLIGQGKATYFAVMGNPDELATTTFSSELDVQDIEMCAPIAYNDLVGGDIPFTLKLIAAPHGNALPYTAEQQKALFPKIWLKLGKQ